MWKMSYDLHYENVSEYFFLYSERFFTISLNRSAPPFFFHLRWKEKRTCELPLSAWVNVDIPLDPDVHLMTAKVWVFKDENLRARLRMDRCVFSIFFPFAPPLRTTIDRYRQRIYFDKASRLRSVLWALLRSLSRRLNTISHLVSSREWSR